MRLRTVGAPAGEVPGHDVDLDLHFLLGRHSAKNHYEVSCTADTGAAVERWGHLVAAAFQEEDREGALAAAMRQPDRRLLAVLMLGAPRRFPAEIAQHFKDTSGGKDLQYRSRDRPMPVTLQRTLAQAFITTIGAWSAANRPASEGGRPPGRRGERP